MTTKNFYIAPAYAECHFCGVPLEATDTPAQNDHWRECQKHPARLELTRLRLEVEALELEVETLRRFLRTQERIQATLNSKLAGVDEDGPA